MSSIRARVVCQLRQRGVDLARSTACLAAAERGIHMQVIAALACAGALWDNVINDHHNEPLPANSTLLPGCRAAVNRRLRRKQTLPEWEIDPLTPLPLADAVRPVPTVRLVYFIMASRSYAHETINRNVRVLQRPGVLQERGANDSNLFLVHADAKLGEEKLRVLRAAVLQQPDVYFIRKPRPVMWAGWSMVLCMLDALVSLTARGLRYEYFINLSDADLAMRVDTEIRAFLSRYPGRSVMSIVKRKKDPNRYKMHEKFRRYCFVRRAHAAPTPRARRAHAARSRARALSQVRARAD
jgi:hypothetical protein